MAQRKPGSANTAKVQRQPTSEITPTTSSGVIAQPQRDDSHMIPTARLRSRAGSQLLKAFARLGKAPASPAPNRNCIVASDAKFQARPVAAVKTDQNIT